MSETRRTKFFIDTEFMENGPSFPLILLSLGIVCEDGREFYVVNDDAPLELANDWVKKNVIPHLGIGEMSVRDIPRAVQDFISPHKPEFWGYYADYDWVVFCQLFGAMIDLPKEWPMYCRDIKQLCDSIGNPKLPEQESTEHNALNDARWNKKAYEFMAAYDAGKAVRESAATPGQHQRGLSGHYAEHLSTHVRKPEECPTCLGIEAQMKATPGQCPTDECAEGWIACPGDNPCKRHEGYWQRYNNQTPQPPESPSPAESTWEAIADRLKGQVYKWQAENERLREALRQAIKMVTHLKLCLDKSDQPLIENAIQGWLALAARESG